MNYWLYDSYTGGIYTQSVANIPVGQWVHLEAYYKIATDNTGRVTVYQNGQQIIDVQNVQTQAPGSTSIYWGVANYTDNIVPSTATIYVDDVAISTTYIPDSSTAPTPVPTLKPTATVAPTSVPTIAPTLTPTTTPVPTIAPTVVPTSTLTPTALPTLTPTVTVVPTVVPTSVPPTVVPTATTTPKPGQGYLHKHQH